MYILKLILLCKAKVTNMEKLSTVEKKKGIEDEKDEKVISHEAKYTLWAKENSTSTHELFIKGSLKKGHFSLPGLLAW